MTTGERVKWAGGLGLGVTLILFMVSLFMPVVCTASWADAALTMLLFPALTVVRVFGFADRLPSNQGCLIGFLGSILFYGAFAWLMLGKPWRKLGVARARRS